MGFLEARPNKSKLFWTIRPKIKRNGKTAVCACAEHPVSTNSCFTTVQAPAASPKYSTLSKCKEFTYFCNVLSLGFLSAVLSKLKIIYIIFVLKISNYPIKSTKFLPTHRTFSWWFFVCGVRVSASITNAELKPFFKGLLLLHPVQLLLWLRQLLMALAWRWLLLLLLQLWWPEVPLVLALVWAAYRCGWRAR